MKNDQNNKLSTNDKGYQATEKPQTSTVYNEDLASGNAEIERGNFITAKNLKIEAYKW